MDISGSTREGWMAFIPLLVFIFIVVYVLGGPEHVITLVARWSMDIVASVAHWVRHL
jgi:hypothetical protein